MYKTPLECLDQDVQEQMLIAAANDQGGTLLELIQGYDSEPFDREIIINALADKNISAKARKAIAILIQGTARTKAHMEEAIAVQAEQLRDFQGHNRAGSKS